MGIRSNLFNNSYHSYIISDKYMNKINQKYLCQFRNIYNAVYKGIHIKYKIKRCARCGKVFVHNGFNKKLHHNLCPCCGTYLRRKVLFTKRRKELRNSITDIELNTFMKEYYPYIVSKISNYASPYMDALTISTFKMIDFLKKKDLINKIDRNKVVNMCVAYLSKVVKGLTKSKETSFSDLSNKNLVKLGLEEYIEDV